MNKWISVDKKLPTKNKEVLVYLPPYFSLGYRSDDKQDPENHEGWVIDAGQYVNKPITHWMTLPKPPIDNEK